MTETRLFKIYFLQKIEKLKKKKKKKKRKVNRSLRFGVLSIYLLIVGAYDFKKKNKKKNKTQKTKPKQTNKQTNKQTTNKHILISEIFFQYLV